MSDAPKLADRAKALAADVQKGARRENPVNKAGVSAAKLRGIFKTGTAPAGVTGRLGFDSEPLSVTKCLGYAAKAVPDSEAKAELDMAARIKAVYGHYLPFSNAPGSILVPASAKYLPTHMGNGVEIPGAKALKAEIGDRLAAGVAGYDPDRLHDLTAKGVLSTKALNTMVDSAGGFTVAPPVLGDLIDLQRNMEVFSRAGATNLTLPANGMIDYPKLVGGATAYWVGESGSVTASQETFGKLELRAKKLAVRVPLTNEMIRFSDATVEGVVRMDMAKQAALKADLAQLEGTGGTQIKGLITYSTAANWTQGVDALLTYTFAGSTFQPQDAMSMVAKLPDEVSPNAWVMRRGLWAAILARRGDAVTAGDNKGPFVWNSFNVTPPAGGGAPQLNGADVVWSSQVAANRGTGSQTYVLTGDFREWFVGRVGVMEFMVDPYTSMQTYTTNIQAIEFIDAGPRHAASFVFGDAVNEA